MNPKVSVVVPIHNAAEYLGQCLDTILMQTLQDIEVICVDDGSTDDSVNILNTYAMLDDRLKVIHQENQGAGSARNRGLQEASGDFLSFLDADDFFVPNMLETLYLKAQKEQADVVVCGYLVFDHQRQQDLNEIKPNTSILSDHPTKFFNALFDFPGSVWNKLFKRDLIINNGIQFDAWSVYSDVSFVASALAASQKISVLPECFLHYRLNTNGQVSMTKMDHPEALPCALNSLWNNLKRLKLDDIYLQPFLGYIHKMLNDHLSYCNEFQKELFLVMLKSYLDPEIYEAFFGKAPIKVSVIIPVYNAEQYLPQCLDSAIYQSLPDIEIICVNDGSTDNSLAILEEYAAKDNRIKILNQKNQKQSIARANAMEIATGEYVQFVDADDWLGETCCECLWLYSKIKNTDMLSFGCTCFDEDKQTVVDNSYYNFTYLPQNFQDAFTPRSVPKIMVQMAVTAWMTFYKHSFLKSNKLTWLRKPLFYEDTYFFTKAVLKADRVAILHNKLYFRRYHSQCTVRQVKNYADFHKVLYLTLKYIHDHESKDLFQLFLNYYTAKLLSIYKTLTLVQQIFFAKYSYKFIKQVYKHLHTRVNPHLEQVAETYILSDLPFRKLLTFKLYQGFASLNATHLSLSLFDLNRSPFELRILGVPVISFKKDIQEERENIFLFGLPVLQRRFLVPKSAIKFREFETSSKSMSC